MRSGKITRSPSSNRMLLPGVAASYFIKRHHMALNKETVLLGAEHPGTRLVVMNSQAGYYLGYVDQDGAPYSRESIYFGTPQAAENVLRLLRT